MLDEAGAGCCWASVARSATAGQRPWRILVQYVCCNDRTQLMKETSRIQNWPVNDCLPDRSVRVAMLGSMAHLPYAGSKKGLVPQPDPGCCMLQLRLPNCRDLGMAPVCPGTLSLNKWNSQQKGSVGQALPCLPNAASSHFLPENAFETELVCHICKA